MRSRTTIYLDDELNDRLRSIVQPRGINRFVQSAIAEKLASMERKRIIAEIREGYEATRDDWDEISEDWAPLEVEGWPE